MVGNLPPLGASCHPLLTTAVIGSRRVIPLSSVEIPTSFGKRRVIPPSLPPYGPRCCRYADAVMDAMVLMVPSLVANPRRCWVDLRSNPFIAASSPSLASGLAAGGGVSDSRWAGPIVQSDCPRFPLLGTDLGRGSGFGPLALCGGHCNLGARAAWGASTRCELYHCDMLRYSKITGAPSGQTESKAHVFSGVFGVVCNG